MHGFSKIDNLAVHVMGRTMYTRECWSHLISSTVLFKESCKN